MSTAETTDMIPADERAPAQAALVPAPQYVTGFDGMGTEPFPDDVRKVLAERVKDSDVEIKPDGIVYMPGVWYRQQLTRAFGPGGWGIAPRTPPRVMGDIVVWDAVLICRGRVVATAVGECAYRANNPNMSYASCVEGAKTDALSRCCKDLGMATELWDAKWRASFMDRCAEQYDGERWDPRAQRKVAKKMWRLKSGKKAAAEEQARGAGGVAPTELGKGQIIDLPDTASANADPRADLKRAEGERGPGKARGSFDDKAGTQLPAGDNGEPASAAAYDAIAGELTRLKWTWQAVKLFFSTHFGITPEWKGSGRRSIEFLSADQAASAYALLCAFGKPLWDAVLGELRARGRVKA